MKYKNLILALTFAISQGIIAASNTPKWLEMITMAVSAFIFAYYFTKHVNNTNDTVFIDDESEI
jgi:hypothetical protein